MSHMSPALLAIIGTVLGGLVAGGAVAIYLARPNRRKLEAEAASVTEQATNMAVQTVKLALDRQDATIRRQDSDMVAARAQIDDLGARVGFLEAALAAAAIADHLSAGRELILRAEIVRLGGDANATLGVEITDVEITEGEDPGP
jgi:hypothetical protein